MTTVSVTLFHNSLKMIRRLAEDPTLKETALEWASQFDGQYDLGCAGVVAPLNNHHPQFTNKVARFPRLD